MNSAKISNKRIKIILIKQQIDYFHADLISSKSVLSRQIQECILDDRRIYIVDVNNTPFGPPANISNKQGEEAINILANAFKKAFLD